MFSSIIPETLNPKPDSGRPCFSGQAGSNAGANLPGLSPSRLTPGGHKVVRASGFRFWVLGFGVQGFRVWGLRVGVWGFGGLRVWDVCLAASGWLSLGPCRFL